MCNQYFHLPEAVCGDLDNDRVNGSVRLSWASQRRRCKWTKDRKVFTFCYTFYFVVNVVVFAVVVSINSYLGIDHINSKTVDLYWMLFQSVYSKHSNPTLSSKQMKIAIQILLNMSYSGMVVLIVFSSSSFLPVITNSPCRNEIILKKWLKLFCRQEDSMYSTLFNAAIVRCQNILVQEVCKYSTVLS